MTTQPESDERTTTLDAPPESWPEESEQRTTDEALDSPAPRRRSRLGVHLFGAMAGLILTPVAIGFLTYGGYRYQQLTDAGATVDYDTRGLVSLGVGAGVLLIVLLSGALSPLGPLLGGLLWGLAPAALYLALPADTVQWVDGAPVAPVEIEVATIGWLTLACFLAVGVSLFGSGLSSALRRR
ncbi:MAG TPA: hypothetical protein VFR22_00535 [Nocardioidaceae bacterium]|nr:hypothetical protein [Nocardioidaceae bacterium]